MVYQGEPCTSAAAPIIKGENTRQERHEAIAAQVERIGQRALPADYHILIDAAFVQRLKDPDSRKIDYIGHFYGSAVCGTVNARNSFGGYTGRHMFLAYFDGVGRLLDLQVYNDEQFSSLKYFDDLATPL